MTQEIHKGEERSERPASPRPWTDVGRRRQTPRGPQPRGGLGRWLPVSSPGLGFQRRAPLPTVQLQELPWIPPPGSPTPHPWAAEGAGEGAHRSSGNGAGSSSCTRATEDLLSLGPLLLATKITVLAGTDRCSGSTGTLALAAPEVRLGAIPRCGFLTQTEQGQRFRLGQRGGQEGSAGVRSCQASSSLTLCFLPHQPPLGSLGTPRHPRCPTAG